jgi:hypothetical protein
MSERELDEKHPVTNGNPLRLYPIFSSGKRRSTGKLYRGIWRVNLSQL